MVMNVKQVLAGIFAHYTRHEIERRVDRILDPAWINEMMATVVDLNYQLMRYRDHGEGTMAREAIRTVICHGLVELSALAFKGLVMLAKEADDLRPEYRGQQSAVAFIEQTIDNMTRLFFWKGDSNA
jgi:hypothetical protein